MNKIEETKKNKTLWLSFIVPVYNGEKYLKDCLDSLLCQNVSYEEYEIICINDGSKDNSFVILDEYAKKYPNLKVIHKENEGVSIARNLGIDLSKGKYIWFVDCDDVIRANCLNKIFELLQENKDIDGIYVEHTKDENILNSKNADEKIDVYIQPYMKGQAVWDTIFKALTIKENGIKFNCKLKREEDNLFHEFFYVYSSGNRMKINNVLYFYRQHSSSVIHQLDVQSRNCHIQDFITRILISKTDITPLVEGQKDKFDFIKELQYLYTGSALFKLPESSLDYNETMQLIKKEGLYPYPFFHSGLKRKEGFKAFCRELARSFFRFEWIYKIYFKIRRKRFNKRNNI